MSDEQIAIDKTDPQGALIRHLTERISVYAETIAVLAPLTRCPVCNSKQVADD